MKKTIQVSVIIPIFNSEKTLNGCLESVLNQSFKNYEVILVDNNSTDKSKQIISSFQNSNKKIRYFFEKEISRGAARNRGEKQAKGDIILMADADCVVPRSWIENMIFPIVANGYDAIQGFQENFQNNFWSKQTQIRLALKMNSFDSQNTIGMIDTKNFAIKTSVLKRLGFTNRKYISGNDTDLSIRFKKNNLKLVFLKSVKVKHNHPNSFRTIVSKCFYRAYWCAIIAKDNKDYLKNTDFLKRTNQTFFSFMKFFPGLFKTLFTKGLKYTYFDLVTGLTWRVGLIYSKIKNYW
ncbi:MAG: glycosyltransferase [DPANN group archaeon]|nr:glycosyltransferase [DPANN group archaeon]